MPRQTGIIAPYTRLLDGGEFVQQLQNAALSVLDACEPNGNFLDGAARPINICDGIYLINHVATLKKWPELVRKIFLQCFMAAEGDIPSSGIFACYAFAKLLLVNDDFDLVSISHDSRFTDESNAKILIKQLINDSSAEVLFELLDHVGTRGQVNINTGSKHGITLEVFSGHKFDIGIDTRFCAGAINRHTAQLFLIDGIIEQISEIDRLLQYCSENKTTCIIVARNFGDNVMSTLNMNFQEKTLDVIPMRVSDKLSNLNVFADLGIVTHSTVIESSGCAVGSFDPNDMKIISGIRSSFRDFSFNATQTASRNVQNRIKKLHKRIRTELIYGMLEKEDIDVLLRSRINSLNTSAATLWLPAESDKNGLYEFVSLRFKFGLGLLDSMCKTGIISLQCPAVTNIFGDLKVDFLPASIMIHSLRVASGIVRSVGTTGGCLVIEQSNS